MTALVLTLPAKPSTAQAESSKATKETKPVDDVVFSAGFQYSRLWGATWDSTTDENLDFEFERWTGRLRFVLLRYLETVTDIGFQKAHLIYSDPNVEDWSLLAWRMEMESDPVAFAGQWVGTRTSLGEYFVLKPFVYAETTIGRGEVRPLSILVNYRHNEIDITDSAEDNIDKATYYDYRVDGGLELHLEADWFRAHVGVGATRFHGDLKIDYTERGEAALAAVHVTEEDIKNGRFGETRYGGYLQPGVGIGFPGGLELYVDLALMRVDHARVYQVSSGLNCCEANR